MSTKYRCANLRRAALVRDDATINGLDYLEVVDQDAPSDDLRQRILVLHLFKSAALTADNIRIEGGVRVRPIRLDGQPQVNGEVVTVRVKEAGDFSTYTLRLVRSRDDNRPPQDFDPQLSAVDFSFKVDCPSGLDCQPARACEPEMLPAPILDYLANDYAGFRRLMLDRLAVTMPGWTERSPADVMMVLVEALAYAADHLSYMQDAVATEMYLGTARLRSSVRRLTRPLDYALGEGTNARVWAVFDTAADLLLPCGLALLTRLDNSPLLLPEADLEAASDAGAQIFELMADTPVFAANNRMQFYTWADENCCLPRGATRATLIDPPNADKRLLLRPGDVLIFEEMPGPITPAARDHRHAVRLTRVAPEAQPAVLVTELALALLEADGLVQAEIDAVRGIGLAHGGKSVSESQFAAEVQAALGAQTARRLMPRLRRRLPPLYRTSAPAVTDNLTGTNVVEIEWHAEDALPFPLCLSSTASGRLVEGLTVAWGNAAPADHGLTRPPEPLPRLPSRGPYRPIIKRTQLVFAGPPVASDSPAGTFYTTDAQLALPAIYLTDAGGDVWRPRLDLLSSDRFAAEFVVEVEDDGRAVVRFGDGRAGRMPNDGLVAVYRTGGGTAGNIGADSLYHVVLSDPALAAVQGVRNPLPAAGGTPPESLGRARLHAPQSFKHQERAVTPEDYAAVAQRHPAVQRAMGTRRWTGSWYTQFVSVDRRGGQAIDLPFEDELRLFLERFRLAGHDLEVDAPRFVPLDVALDVCMQPGAFAGVVEAALLRTFSSRGGFFDPDRFTFGQPVYLSRVVAAAMGTPGVEWVQVTRFRRWGTADDPALDSGVLPMARLEIPRLDNDPSTPENGRIVFHVMDRDTRGGTGL